MEVLRLACRLIFYAPYTIYPEVTHMTASEFAGHIDDIGSEYDMIYIGDKKQMQIIH